MACGLPLSVSGNPAGVVHRRSTATRAHDRGLVSPWTGGAACVGVGGPGPRPCFTASGSVLLGRDVEPGPLKQCFKWQLRSREATVTVPTQPTPMTGALAANFYQGSRSEYLAQYIFSTFGTSLLVPRQEDYGLDLFCALTERIGRRAWPYAYYAVQVKSGADAWRIRGRKSVEWPINYPTSLIYCVVDKRKGRLRAYQTSARFLASFASEPPEQMNLIPGKTSGPGRPTSWDSAGNFQLGPPILDLTVNELGDPQRVALYGQVLRTWVTVDEANIRRRRMGVLSWSMPPNCKYSEFV